MRYERSNKYTPRTPLCPSCAQIMRVARITSRFGGLPDLYTFECRACGVSHIEAGVHRDRVIDSGSWPSSRIGRWLIFAERPPLIDEGRGAFRMRTWRVGEIQWVNGGERRVWIAVPAFAELVIGPATSGRTIQKQELDCFVAIAPRHEDTTPRL